MQASTQKSRPAVACLMAALLWAASSVEAWGQADAEVHGLGANENVFQVVNPRSNLEITEQFSRVFECPNRIVRVDGFDPDVITVAALSPTRLRVHGEKTGVTTLVITDEFDNAYSVEVFVGGDVRHLQAYLRQLFPEDDVQAVKLNESIVLRGVVTEPGHITQIVDVALEFSTKVLNQMEVGGVHQVQLNVKVMEVQRTKIRQLGFNFLLNTQDTYLASTPGSLINITDLSTPFGGPATVGFTGLDSAVQFAIMGSSTVFNGFLDALRNENLLKILAEPELVTTSGRPATILSGGEFPILVPQSLGTVTIEWREFGVRMEAVPVVLGNGRLRLDVAPEVSERDFSNSVTIEGMVVPGITTRRVNTQVEMRFGETLMIGGLISSRKSGETNKVPFLGELPWVGTAFRTVRHDQSETELMILVTPHMVAPLAPHQVPHMGPGQFTDDPTDRELYFDGMLEVPLYGPECNGCEVMGGYGAAGGAGGYGGYGGFGNGTPGGGAYCGDGCLNPAQAVPGSDGLMVPEETQSDVQPLPPMTEAYEGGPQTGAPLFNAPPLPGQETAPAETQPVNQDAASKLPPLPGQAQTAPAAGPNQPASLGLIDPFRRSVRTGRAPVQVQTQSVRPTTAQQPIGHSTSNAGLIRPQSNIIQTGATLSAPQPARALIR